MYLCGGRVSVCLSVECLSVCLSVRLSVSVSDPVRLPSLQVTPEELTGLVVEFVRTLASADDLDEVGALVFQSATDPRVAKLRHSVRYYTDASRDDLKYKPVAGE